MNHPDSATPQQLERLHHLGIPCSTSMPRSFADCAIRYHQATDQQLTCLARMGIHIDKPICRQEASDLIGKCVVQRRQLTPTDNQRRLLMQHGKWRDDLTRGQAWDLIAQIKAGQNRYR